MLPVANLEIVIETGPCRAEECVPTTIWLANVEYTAVVHRIPVVSRLLLVADESIILS